MPDVREQIIERLMAIAEDIDDVKTVLRNVMAIDEDNGVLPAVIILDGDETAIEDEPSRRPSTVPRRVEMTPLLLIAFAEKPGSVGTDLNTLRKAIIKAVVSDDGLMALVDRYGIRYDGMETPRHESGRLMIGQRFMRFTFTYILAPLQL